MNHAIEGRKVDPRSFDVTEGELKIVSLTCDVVLYTSHDLSAISSEVVYVYERFLLACPPESLKWYSTENMSRHKTCTPRALNMLRGWLRPGAPHREIINIHLKDGVSYADAATYSFWVWGSEKGEARHGIDSNSIRCTFPVQWAVDKPGEFRDFAIDLCNHFPFQSGHGGYALETTHYRQEPGDIAAWKLSTQHPGLDIARPIVDRVALQREGIKGVNWLTMLCDEFVDRIGGATTLREQLPDSVRLIPVTGGLVFQAGQEPKAGHVNRNDRLPDYKAVYKVVAPLQQPIIDRYGALDLPGGDHREKTQAWLRRFADD